MRIRVPRALSGWRTLAVACVFATCATLVAVMPAYAATAHAGAYAGPTVEATKEGRFKNAPALSLTVSRGRVGNIATTGYYGEPGHCGGVLFGRGLFGHRISLPAMRIAPNGAFSSSRRLFRDVSIRVSGRFSGSGKIATGVIRYRERETQQFAGCNFDVDFRVHLLRGIPHGATGQPATVSRYTGESYQAEKATMRIAPDRTSIARLDITLRGACRNGDNFRESFSSVRIPIGSKGRFAFDNSFRDSPDSANARLTGNGAFVGARRTATGSLRIQLKLDNGITCESGPVTFVAGP